MADYVQTITNEDKEKNESSSTQKMDKRRIDYVREMKACSKSRCNKKSESCLVGFLNNNKKQFATYQILNFLSCKMITQIPNRLLLEMGA